MDNRWRETGHASQADRNAEAKRLCDDLADSFEAMTPREQRFVEQMTESLDRWGATAIISAKQLFWLRDLREKY